MRKSLGRHEIATVQTTSIDDAAGLIRLTTTLAHSSGEWVSSDWPVCLVSETNTPHRMGAALTYARRYALFTLVGIAGEDDLDAPDLLTEPSLAVRTAPGTGPGSQNDRKPPNGPIHKPRQPKPLLAAEPSAALRGELLAEIQNLKDPDGLALWAHRRLPAKNMLTADDARAIEAAYLERLGLSNEQPLDASPALNGSMAADSPLFKTTRKRNKAHLAFVAAQACLICKRSPCDAHHLRFAQPRSLGRKVSDEFTVPLCREHHRDLHRHGNEVAWWSNVQVAPIEVAKDLWQITLLQPSPAIAKGNALGE